MAIAGFEIRVVVFLIGSALRGERKPLDAATAGVAATTREFADTVLGLLPSARRDTEFALGVGR